MIAVLASPARDGRIMAIVGAAHGGSHFFHVVLPPLFPLLAAEFDLSGLRLGLLMTVFFATSGLCQTPAGFLVDRIGAARVLIAGLAGLGLGALLLATATSYPVLLGAVVMMGVGNSVFHPADFAILGHHVGAGRLGRAYAIHTLGGSFGWALGPVTMIAIASLGGWRLALLGASLVGFGLALVVALGRGAIDTPDRRRQGALVGTGSGVLITGPVLACFAFFALLSSGFITLQGFMPLALNALHGVPLAAATVAITAYMLGMAGGTLLGGIVADRGAEPRVIVCSGLAASACLVLLAGTVAMPVALLWLTIGAAGACSGVTLPSRDLLIRAATPPGATGKVFGFVYSGLDLGSTVAPLVAGLLIDEGLHRAVFVMIAAATGLSTAAALVVRRHPSEGNRAA